MNTGRGANPGDPSVQTEFLRAQIKRYEAKRTESQQFMQRMSERVNQLEVDGAVKWAVVTQAWLITTRMVMSHLGPLLTLKLHWMQRD